MKVKEKWKGWLKTQHSNNNDNNNKLNIQKTKIMVSSPIPSGKIDGETVETVAHFFGRVSKITWWLIWSDKIKANKKKKCLK